jgi:hypothetical protein
MACCWHCGEPCSGDTTERIDIGGMVGEQPICDDPDNCPANVIQAVPSKT